MSMARVVTFIIGIMAAGVVWADDGPSASPFDDRVGTDPANVLESAWMDAVLSADSRRMSALGVGSALSGDRAFIRTRDLSLTEPVSAQLDYIKDPFNPSFARVVRLSLLRSAPLESGRSVNLSGTLGFARGARLAPGVRMRNLMTVRAAVSAPIGESFRANFRASYLSGTGVRSRFIGYNYEMRDPAAFAMAASIEYARGDWHAGPFVQWSKAGEDVVNVAGVSASRRISKRATGYAAYYGYRFSQTDPTVQHVNTAGNALVLGFDYKLR